MLRTRELNEASSSVAMGISPVIAIKLRYHVSAIILTQTGEVALGVTELATDPGFHFPLTEIGESDNWTDLAMKCRSRSSRQRNASSDKDCAEIPAPKSAPAADFEPQP